MGCDIHAFIEYVKYDSCWSLTHGELNIPRDYALFSVLALGEGGINNELHYPPRGLPADLSSDSNEFFYTSAEEVQEMMSEWLGDEEEYKSQDYAAEAGEAARKKYLEEGLLPTPELYAHSWLNLTELKQVLTQEQLTKEKLSPEFRAIVAAMEKLAEQYGPEKVRLVFCFDGAG